MIGKIYIIISPEIAPAFPKIDPTFGNVNPIIVDKLMIKRLNIKPAFIDIFGSLKISELTISLKIVNKIGKTVNI